MREWKVEGFKEVNYQSRKTGRQVEGVTIYLSAAPASPDVVGREVKEIYLSRSACVYKPVVGDKVSVFYNERGYVDDVSPVR